MFFLQQVNLKNHTFKMFIIKVVIKTFWLAEKFKHGQKLKIKIVNNHTIFTDFSEILKLLL